jgi:hypothetical protein
MQNHDKRRAGLTSKGKSGRSAAKSPPTLHDAQSGADHANAAPSRRATKQMEAEPPQGEKGDIPRV